MKAVAAAVLLVTSVAAPVFAAEESNAVENSDTTTAKPLALNSMNEKFRNDYAKAKLEIKEHLGPLILCMNDDLILINGKERETVRFIKPRYTGLKEVSHITLDTFVLLVNHTDTPLTEARIARLKEFRDVVTEATPKVKTGEALVESDAQKEAALIKESLAFLNKVIADRTVSNAALMSFVRSTAKPDLDNAYEAAGVQLTAMDNAVDKWRGSMTAEQWKNLRVIIVTHHMPRQDLVAFQYFKKILNQTQEGDKIIVAETINDVTEEQAIDLLLTHMLDKKIGIAFFDDPWRMHRDLLSDGAKSWLEKHPPKAQGNAVGTSADR